MCTVLNDQVTTYAVSKYYMLEKEAYAILHLLTGIFDLSVNGLAAAGDTKDCSSSWE